MQDNGFQRGDILVEADGTALTDSSILTNKLMEKSPGDTITFKVYRTSDQKYYEVTVTLEDKSTQTEIQSGNFQQEDSNSTTR